MDKYVQQIMEEFFDFNMSTEYIFRKIYGFTFVFRRDFAIINDQISSAAIEPLGIIYEENDEFYYAPLYEGDEIEAIVKEFVKNI